MSSTAERRAACLLAVLLSAAVLLSCGGDSSGGAASSVSGGGDRAQPTDAGSDPPAAGFRDTSGTEIPAFGVEASPTQRAAAQSMLSDYLRAAQAGEWARACGYLSTALEVQLMQMVAKERRVEDRSCKNALRLIAQQVSKEGFAYRGPAPIAALRIKEGGTAGEGAGFALFHGVDGMDYWVMMRREGGEWRVGSPNPHPLR